MNGPTHDSSAVLLRFGCFAVFALGLVIPQLGFSQTTKQPKTAELLSSSAAVLVVDVHTVDVQAGTEESPAISVEFETTDVFLGNAQSGFVLPEGQFQGTKFLDRSGTPSFLPGQTYLLFLIGGEWYSTPISHGEFGVLRKYSLAGKELWVTPSGHCVEMIGEVISIGGRVAWSQSMLGPVINGEQLVFDSYHSDMDLGVEEEFEANADACPTADQLLVQLEAVIAEGEYEGSPFAPESVLEDSASMPAFEGGGIEGEEIDMCVEDDNGEQVCEEAP